MIKKWVPVFVVFAILTAGWFFKPAAVSPIPLCPLKYFLHLDCPGCGLTRSFLSLSRGHWEAAIDFNPAGPLIYLFFIFYLYDLICRALSRKVWVPPLWLVKSYSTLLFVILMGQWIFKLRR